MISRRLLSTCLTFEVLMAWRVTRPPPPSSHTLRPVAPTSGFIIFTAEMRGQWQRMISEKVILILSLRISNTGLTASRPNALSEFNDAIVMSNRPLRDGELFEIQLERMVGNREYTCTVNKTGFAGGEVERQHRGRGDPHQARGPRLPQHDDGH